MEKYSDSQLYSDFVEISEFPTYAKGLSDYQIEKLFDFVQQKRHSEEADHALKLSMNPQMPASWPGSSHRQSSIFVEQILIKEIKQRQQKANSSKFVKSKNEQRENGQKGGIKKRENKYNAFKDFITKNKIDLADYKDKGGESFAIALKQKGFKIDPKTVDKYRKQLQEESNAGK